MRNSTHLGTGVLLCAGLVLALTGNRATADGIDPCVFQPAPIGDAVDLSTGATTQRRTPVVAYNAADDEYLIVWFDTRNPGNNDIFGQRVSGAGDLEGGNIAVMEFVDAQIDPFVAYNSIDNNYLVVWRTQQPGNFNDARGRIVAADGSLPGNDFFITDAGNELSIVHNPLAEEFLVVGRSPGIRGRRVSGAGAPLGAQFVITSAGAPAPNGQVAYNENADEYLATWRNQSDQNLQGRRIAPDGTLLGTPILISSLFPASGRAASVSFDPVNDRYLVVFGEFQEPNIYGQFVSGAGTLIGGNFLIADNAPGSTSPYLVYSDVDELFLVVWRTGSSIVGQVLLEDGTLSGDRVTLVSGTVTGDPRMAYNSLSDEFLVTWSDNRNLPEQEDIFAQRVVVGLTPLLPGDLDCSGLTDVLDFDIFLSCVSGPGQTNPPQGCDPTDFVNADMDDDRDVDFTDAGLFFLAITVP